MGLDRLNYMYESQLNGLKLEHYVYRIGSYHLNWHTDFELFTVVRGEAEVCASGRRFVLEEDDMLLVNPNEVHATLGIGGESIAMVLHFDPSFLKAYFPDAERLVFHLHSDESSRFERPFLIMRSCLAQMMVFRSRGDAMSSLRYDAAFFRLAATMVSMFPHELRDSAGYRVGKEGGRAVDRLSRYVDRNYRDRITLADLARETGYNASYISQMFKRELGINFSDYVTRVRLAAATRALSSNGDRIADIALAYGFSDLKSFNAAFKKTFGKSPAAYRKLLNDDIRAGDSSFKIDFVPAEDAYVSQKLATYMTAEFGDARDEEAPRLLESKRATELAAMLIRARELVDDVAAELGAGK